MAVETLVARVNPSSPLGAEGFVDTLQAALEEANDKIFAQSRDNKNERGMGTTCTAAAVVGDQLIIGQIGDSRCYLKRGDRLALVTKDQSLAWQLVEAGAMTAEEAKHFEHANIILQALGVQERIEVALTRVPLRRGDTLLICSDGLHGPVSDEDILETLMTNPAPADACQRLIAKSLEHEGPDNVTVVVSTLDGEGLPEPEPGNAIQVFTNEPPSAADIPDAPKDPDAPIPERPQAVVNQPPSRSHCLAASATASS